MILVKHIYLVEDDEELERERSSRLMAVKQAPEPVEEKSKVKRLRIEDSDEDE